MAMEWTANDDLMDFPEDPFTFTATSCPESFFDSSLDAMDVFGKDLFFCPPVSAANEQRPSQQQQHSMEESLDLESFLHTAMADVPVLLSDHDGNSVSDIIHTDNRSNGGTGVAADPVVSFLADFDSLSQEDQQLGLDSDKQCDVTKTEPADGIVIKEEEEVVGEPAEMKLSLEAVEIDIAKLKQEVDYAYDTDENSMWSDFFSEEDPSEISREYDDLLQCLLSTPVNDIDLSLAVFNNVDEEEEEEEKESVRRQRGALTDQQSLLESIQADHCYTLARAPPSASAASSMLTPPPSSDESDRDEESSRDSSGQDVGQTVTTTATTPHLQVPKFTISRSSISSQHSHRRPHHSDLTSGTRIVKLKQHHSDLKFVFSVKLKDEATAATAAPAGRSLLKKNAAAFASSSRQQPNPSHHRHQLLSSSAGSSRLSGDLLEAGRRPVGKTKHRLRAEVSGDSDLGEFNETVCAVQSLIQAETAAGLGKFVPDFKNRKMQIDREIHNSMERQRRIELKREFDSLKSLIPEVAANDKVSKLTLLNVAARYVGRLETSQSKLRWRRDLLREKKKQLMQRLNFLHMSA